MKELTRQERKELREQRGFLRILHTDGGYYGLKEYVDDCTPVMRYGWIGNADECRQSIRGEERG